MGNTDNKFYGLSFAGKFKLLIVVLIALASLFGGASYLLGGLSKRANGIDDEVHADPIYAFSVSYGDGYSYKNIIAPSTMSSNYTIANGSSWANNISLQYTA